MFLLLACSGAGPKDEAADTVDSAVDSPSDTAEDAGGDTSVDTAPTCSEDEQGELYERYIEPLVAGEASSSCNECHLAGVDLSMFVRGTPCQSMACLVDLSLVDFADPAASAVLEFITQGEPASELIDDEVRQREYDGFLEWIAWSAVCHDDVCETYDNACGDVVETSDPGTAATPLGTCTEDELVRLFHEKVMAWEGRCSSCHWSEGAGRSTNSSAPVFFASASSGAEGDLDWARGTMYNLVGLGAIDLADPAASTLMTKPLDEGATAETVVGAVTGIEHGGGDKIHVSDDGEAEQTLYDYADWIAAYVACFE